MDRATEAPLVTGFFEPVTSSITYVVADPRTGACAVIDPVLDFDQRAGRVSTASADRVADFVLAQGYRCGWVLDTHVHADHMTALPHLQRRLGGKTGIGGHVTTVQAVFRDFYDLGGALPTDGRQFDHLFADGEEFHIGGITARALHSPGHTPACVAYLVGDALFCGDTLLMPDMGTARCDFPGGDAATLFRSVRRLLELPAATRVFVGHDYGPNGRAIAWETTVAAQREGNIHVRDGVAEGDFTAMRSARDATLDLPTLMLASIQVNIRAGRLPEPGGNGVSYLKIPLTAG